MHIYRKVHGLLQLLASRLECWLLSTASGVGSGECVELRQLKYYSY